MEAGSLKRAVEAMLLSGRLSTIHMPFISTKKNGLGLGLSKAYAIIEEHGGSISCSSTVGEGTVFTVCLNR